MSKTHIGIASFKSSKTYTSSASQLFADVMSFAASKSNSYYHVPENHSVIAVVDIYNAVQVDSTQVDTAPVDTAQVDTDIYLIEDLTQRYRSCFVPVIVPDYLSNEIAHNNAADINCFECFFSITVHNGFPVVTVLSGIEQLDLDSIDEELDFEYHVASALNVDNDKTYQPD